MYIPNCKPFHIYAHIYIYILYTHWNHFFTKAIFNRIMTPKANSNPSK